MSHAKVHAVMHHSPAQVEKTAKQVTGPKKHGKTVAAAKSVSRRVMRKKA